MRILIHSGDIGDWSGLDEPGVDLTVGDRFERPVADFRSVPVDPEQLAELGQTLYASIDAEIYSNSPGRWQRIRGVITGITALDPSAAEGSGRTILRAVRSTETVDGAWAANSFLVDVQLD